MFLAVAERFLRRTRYQSSQGNFSVRLKSLPKITQKIKSSRDLIFVNEDTVNVLVTLWPVELVKHFRTRL